MLKALRKTRNLHSFPTKESHEQLCDSENTATVAVKSIAVGGVREGQEAVLRKLLIVMERRRNVVLKLRLSKWWCPRKRRQLKENLP